MMDAKLQKLLKQKISFKAPDVVSMQPEWQKEAITGAAERAKENPVAYDPLNDVLVIYGIRYSMEMFRQMAFMPKEDGRWLKILDRQDGVITVKAKDWEASTKALLGAAKAVIDAWDNGKHDDAAVGLIKAVRDAEKEAGG
jgi:hypothetical protein